MNFIAIQTMAITRIAIRIVVKSGISDSVIVNMTVLHYSMYKICAETIAELAIIRYSQDQEISLLAGVQ